MYMMVIEHLSYIVSDRVLLQGLRPSRWLDERVSVKFFSRSTGRTSFPSCWPFLAREATILLTCTLLAQIHPSLAAHPLERMRQCYADLLMAHSLMIAEILGKGIPHQFDLREPNERAK